MVLNSRCTRWGRPRRLPSSARRAAVMRDRWAVTAAELSRLLSAIAPVPPSSTITRTLPSVHAFWSSPGGTTGGRPCAHSGPARPSAMATMSSMSACAPPARRGRSRQVAIVTRVMWWSLPVGAASCPRGVRQREETPPAGGRVGRGLDRHEWDGRKAPQHPVAGTGQLLDHEILHPLDGVPARGRGFVAAQLDDHADRSVPRRRREKLLDRGGLCSGQPDRQHEQDHQETALQQSPPACPFSRPDQPGSQQRQHRAKRHAASTTTAARTIETWREAPFGSDGRAPIRQHGSALTPWCAPGGSQSFRQA